MLEFKDSQFVKAVSLTSETNHLWNKIFFVCVCVCQTEENSPRAIKRRK